MQLLTMVRNQRAKDLPRKKPASTKGILRWCGVNDKDLLSDYLRSYRVLIAALDWGRDFLRCPKKSDSNPERLEKRMLLLE